tara:strand:- start:3595 stop:6006 length:2412 start_codon:yes stop_codon:yes gene_type:complete
VPTEVIEVKAVGKDEVTAELKRVQRAMGKLEKDLKSNEAAAKDTRNAFQKMSGGISKVTGVVRAMQAAFAASVVAEFGGQLFEAGKQGAVVADQFDILKGRIGDLPLLMDRAREATANMIPDKDLQESIALFDSFDIPLERIPEALEQVSKTAMRTGQDAAFLASSLSTGIARVSPQILDNLGIQIKLSQVTEAATEQFGKQADQLTEVEKKTALLNLVLDRLAEKNADIEFNKQRTAVFNQLSTAIENAKTEMGGFIADVLSSYQYLMRESSTATEDLAEAMLTVSSFQHTMEGVQGAGDGVSNSLSNMLLGLNETSEAMAIQSEAARAAGEALRRIPVEERKEAFDRLLTTFQNIPQGLRLLIRELGGVDEALKKASTSAEVAAFDFAEFQGFIATGGAPAGIRGEGAILRSDRGRRSSPRGGRRTQADSARAELIKAQKLADLQAAESQAARIMLETDQKIAEVQARALQISKRLRDEDAGRLFAQVHIHDLITAQNAELSKLEAIEERAAQEDQKRLDALRAVQDELALIEATRGAELQLLTEGDPLVRAELQLQLEKSRIMHEMRSLNDEEHDSVIRRAEAQHRLNMAMATYSATVKEVEHANFTDQMARASDIAGRAAKELAGSHETLGKVMDVASQSVKGITASYDAYEKGQIAVGEAVVSATAGMGAAVAGQIEDERARAAVLGAIEAAMSAAAFARLDIPAGVAHLAAASMFTAVAAGAGGGGGASGGGGGGAAAAGAQAERERDQQGGFGEGSGRQVIVQFGSGVVLGSAQQVAKAIQQADHSARGTGHAAGY